MNSIQHCHMAHQIQILPRVAVCETITDLAGRAEHPKFITGSIRTGVLHFDNMSFRLFSELIDSLSSKTFRYSNETMMWWTTGYKMFWWYVTAAYGSYKCSWRKVILLSRRNHVAQHRPKISFQTQIQYESQVCITNIVGNLQFTITYF